MINDDGKFRILIASADEAVRAALSDALGELFQVNVVDSAAHIIEIMENHRHDAAFIGWGMPGLSLPELLEILADKRLNVRTVLVAKESETNIRADALDAGAEAILTYPFDPREAVALAQRLKRASSEEFQRNRYVERMKSELLDIFAPSDNLIRSALNRVFALAKEESPALFQGEMGTGKRLTAKAMTFAGQRPFGPFGEFTVRGRSVADVELGLFGSGKIHGAIDNARGGAILISGIGELPMRLQEKLYRSVKTNWGVVRFLFSTRIDLHGAVLRGEFNEELWKLIEGNSVVMPALRERPVEAVEGVARKIVSSLVERLGSPVKEIHPAAMKLLRSYPWPGNMREMERVLVMGVCRSGGTVLLPDDLPTISPAHVASAARDDLSLEESIAAKLAPLVDTIEDLPEGELYNLMLARFERPLIKLVLHKLRGNQVKAAKALGLHRNTLRKKLRELGLSAKSPF